MASDRMKALPERSIFSLFLTAGYPRIDDTRVILRELQEAGVDMIEIGFPFSDPIADGPTIQAVNTVALQNGMNLHVLFDQLEGMREEISVPVFLMGYMNPMMQFGIDKFLERAAQVGVDALIIPDMPFDEYCRRYRKEYDRYGIRPVFLVTSRTSEERIREFDDAHPAFIYVVSSDATTGGKVAVDGERQGFFARLSAMKLKSRLIVGFGVADRESFEAVTKHTHGAIVASAFLRTLKDIPAGVDVRHSDAKAISATVINFVSHIRGGSR